MKNKLFLYVYIAAGILLTVFLLRVVIGCASPQSSSQAFSISSIIPADQAGDVFPDIEIAIALNKAADPASIGSSTITLSSAEGVVTGSASYDADNQRIIFNPLKELEFSTNYTVTLSGSVKDPSGAETLPSHSWSFTSVAKDYSIKGIMDNDFGVNGLVKDDNYTTGGVGGTAATIDPAGRILVAGKYFSKFGSDQRWVIWRFYPSGTPDRSFADRGKLTFNADASTPPLSILVDSNGNILTANNKLIMRFDTAGNLDASFGTGGTVTFPYDLSSVSLAIDPNGRLLVAGTQIDPSYSGPLPAPTNNIILAYTAQGALDAGFGSAGRMIFQGGRGLWKIYPSGGKLLVLGASDAGFISLWRYDPDGSSDGSFGTNGYISFEVDNAVSNFTVDATGKIYLVGAVYDSSVGHYNLRIWRYTSDGGIDGNFGDRGKITYVAAKNAVSSGNDLLLDKDGKIVIVGGNPLLALFRFHPDGTIDTSFGTDGTAAAGLAGVNPLGMLQYAFLGDSHGRLLLVGEKVEAITSGMVLWRFK